MSEMVERVAKALVDRLGESGLIYASPEFRRRLSRAAIAAMREPTPDMVRQGEMQMFEHMAEARDWTVKATLDAWQAMIDAALK